jgi:vancomycin resistance protein YoaR
LRSKIDTRKFHRLSRAQLMALITVGAIVVAVVLAILVDSALYYNKVHAGVKVDTVSLGGLTQDEAIAALNDYLEDAQQSPIVLTSSDWSKTIMPADVGTEMDVAGAVAQAMDVGRDKNFFSNLGKRFKLYFSEVQIPLKGALDNTKMSGVLQAVARELDVQPINAGLAIEGTEIKVIESQDGLVVDQETLRKNLEAVLFTFHSTELEVPMVVKKPDVQVEDNQAALEQAKIMISAPLRLTAAGKTWMLTPENIAAAMGFTSEDRGGVSTLVPLISAEKLDLSAFDEIEKVVATEPVNATFDSDGAKAWVVPGVPGEGLDREKTVEALIAAALTTNSRTVEVVVTTVDPELTTEEAEAMGIKDRLASYTTEPYRGSANRQVNVRITTQYASNVMLAPGAVYDFDKQIGPRTSARGYKPAPGIVAGGEMENVLGGGICQVSTTLFNAVYEAGLEVVERHNHSLYISHYPDGRDATVTAGGKNFRFRNNTDHYIWIRGVSDGVTTTFNIYGTSDGRKVKSSFSGFSYGAGRTEVTIINKSLAPGSSRVKISGQSGRSCSVTRTITWPDGTTKTEKFPSNYPMIPRTTEVNPSSTTSTTAPGKPTSTTVPGPTPSTTPPTSPPTTSAPPSTSPPTTGGPPVTAF